MARLADGLRAPRTALLAICALAILLRVVRLDTRTLWYDEAFSALFAQTGWSSMIEGTLTPVGSGTADVHPLLYYELLNFWMRFFGDGVAAIRLLSVMFGALTIPIVYALGRDWFGARAGLVVALITAVAPFHVQYSQEARMYALLTLALVTATWLYWRAWTRGRVINWAGFTLAAALSMYTQQLAAFYLIALGLLPALLRDWRQLGRTALAAGAAFVLYLPWFVYLPGQLDNVRRYWLDRPHILSIWLALRSFFSINLDFDTAWWLPTFFLAALLPTLLFLQASRVLRRSSPDRATRRALIGALWLGFAPIGLMWLASVIFQPVFLPRALLPSAVMLYVALGWLFTRGDLPRAVSVLVIVAWAVVIAFGLWTHYRWDTFPNPPFDRAAVFLRQNARPGDAILHGNKLTALPLRYYAPALPQTYVRDIPDSGSDTLAVPTQRALGWLASACPAEAAGGAGRVWYVAFQQFDEEMAEAVARSPGAVLADSGAWLRAHYTEREGRRFNDLIVTLFTDPDATARAAACPDSEAG